MEILKFHYILSHIRMTVYSKDFCYVIACGSGLTVPKTRLPKVF